MCTCNHSPLLQSYRQPAGWRRLALGMASGLAVGGRGGGCGGGDGQCDVCSPCARPTTRYRITSSGFRQPNPAQHPTNQQRPAPRANRTPTATQPIPINRPPIQREQNPRQPPTANQPANQPTANPPTTHQTGPNNPPRRNEQTHSAPSSLFVRPSYLLAQHWHVFSGHVFRWAAGGGRAAQVRRERASKQAAGMAVDRTRNALDRSIIA